MTTPEHTSSWEPGVTPGLREAVERVADRLAVSAQKGREDVSRDNEIWAWVLDLYAYDLRAALAAHPADPKPDSAAEAERDRLATKVEALQAKVDAARRLAQTAERRAMASSSRTFDGTPFPAQVSAVELLAALAGTPHPQEQTP